MNRSIKCSIVLALLVFSQGTLRPETAVTKFWNKNKKAIAGGVAAAAVVGIAIGAAFLAKKTYDATSDIKDTNERLWAAPVVAILYPLGMERTTSLLVKLVERGSFTTEEMADFVTSDTGAALAKSWGKSHAEFILYATAKGLQSAGHRMIKDAKNFFDKLATELVR